MRQLPCWFFLSACINRSLYGSSNGDFYEQTHKSLDAYVYIKADEKLFMQVFAEDTIKFFEAVFRFYVYQ